MLPTLDAFAYYGGSGVGGSVNPAIPNCANTTSTFCFNPAKAPPPFQTSNNVGYGGTLNQPVNSTPPDKRGGLTLNIPLPNPARQPHPIRPELDDPPSPVHLPPPSTPNP